MKESREAVYFRTLLERNGISVPQRHAALYRDFANSEASVAAYKTIEDIQKKIMSDWQEREGIADVLSAPLQLPNAKAGKPYSHVLQLEGTTLGDAVQAWEIVLPENTGLSWDAETSTLSGTPIEPGEYPLVFRFRHNRSAEDAPMQDKKLALIVNPDPKSLWKELPSDTADAFYKPDAKCETQSLAGRTAIAASKRGRSHAHEGKFREDDFLLTQLENDWALLAVADGAGSAKSSRRGSVVACDALKEFYSTVWGAEKWAALEAAIAGDAAGTEGGGKALSAIAMEALGKAAHFAHKKLESAAAEHGSPLKDFSTTLLYALVKKYPQGWFIATFSVGDGGIGIYTREPEGVKQMGTPDGGEFAGQTRFITMPDIFTDPAFYSRCAITTVPDFTALILMTDGVTDPKFSTDAALGKPEKWTALWDDLNGTNEDGAAVQFTETDPQVAAEQLLSWLDFWSPGNHDDRTIAILF